MNIDELKDTWNKDEFEGMQLNLSKKMQGTTNSAVSKIRKNMQNEFITVIISYAVFIALMFYGLNSLLFFNITSIFMLIILILTGFYFFRFFLFYKSMGRFDLSLKNSIRKITYEMELNTEIYKAYNLCIAPIAVIIAFSLLFGNSKIDFMGSILASGVFHSGWVLPIAFLIILISFIITYICINFHIRLQYGKYIDELKMIMHDLGEEL